MNHIRNIIHQGLWKNNPALVQLIGLCPLLAGSNTIVNALGLGLATTLVLTATSTTISLLRYWIPFEVRIPIYVMIIAGVVSSVERLMNAYAFDLYQSLGIFLPLIVTNCIIIGRAEVWAVKNTPGLSALDGVAMGAGITVVLLVLGSLREVLGTGMLFTGADRLPGYLANIRPVQIIHWDNPFLLALLPTGAFIGLGMMLALKSVIDGKITARQRKIPTAGTIFQDKSVS